MKSVLWIVKGGIDEAFDWLSWSRGGMALLVQVHGDMGIGSVCYSEPRSPGTICWPLLLKNKCLFAQIRSIVSAHVYHPQWPGEKLRENKIKTVQFCRYRRIIWWTQTSKQPYETQVEERRGSKSVTPQASFDTVDTDSDSDSEMTYRRRRGRRRVNLPRLRQKLTGHRNARTMIKVATILWKILIASAGGGLVGEGLHLVRLWLRPPLCLGPQVGGVRDHAWSWQVQFTKLH